MAFDSTFDSVLSGFNDLSDIFGKYIVTPVNNFGVGGFIFDIEGDSKIDLTAEITDHFTESNYSVQDHIAIRPKRIRLDTYVGEVVSYAQGNSPSPSQTLARKLNILNSYLPELSAGAAQARSLVESNFENSSVLNFVNPALNVYAFLKNALPPTTKQEQAYQYFKALMESKTLVSCQTPFEFCTNMAVEAVFATQRDESRYISNFSVVLKEIRIVSSASTIASAITDIITNRSGVQDSPLVDGGKTQGSKVSATLPVILKDAYSEAF